MEDITFDLTAAIDAGQSWIDHDKSSYELTYDWAYTLGCEVVDALAAGYKDRKAVALKLNAAWGISDKGAETRCRRAFLIATTDAKGILAYDKWAGDTATVAGLVAWIDNGCKPPVAPTPPAKVVLTPKQQAIVTEKVDAIQALLKGQPAAVKAAILKKLA